MVNLLDNQGEELRKIERWLATVLERIESVKKDFLGDSRVIIDQRPLFGHFFLKDYVFSFFHSTCNGLTLQATLL